MELYIQGERVEMFGEGGVEISDTIQNTKDIKKIFTSFSQQFSLPASKEVNKIFKHYYDVTVTNGFDARFKVDAIIKLRGVDFRKGKVRLNGVKKKLGVPYSYQIVFFGETVELKDLLGEDELSSLDLSTYNHTYGLSQVKTGFNIGLGVAGASSVAREIIYPFISHTRQFQYDANGFHQFGNNSSFLEYTDLKPAIKVKLILEAIETKYSIDFSNDYFNDTDFQELYLWLHREKGNITSGNESQSFAIDLDDWSLDGGSSDFRPLTTSETGVGLAEEKIEYNFKVTVTPVTTSGAGAYELRIKDVTTGDIVASFTNQTGTNTFTGSIESVSSRTWDLRTEIFTEGELLTFNLDLEIERIFGFWDDDGGGGYFWNEIISDSFYSSTSPTESMVGEITISDQMPKMKVIDFLTAIFQSFNLTAYKDSVEIVVKTLDQYYSEGNTIDISEFVNPNESKVKRVLPFRTVNFKFASPKTYLAIKRFELLNEQYGNLEYTGGDTFDGGSYNIQIPFEKMVFERIQNEVNSTPSQIGYGWFVDGNQAPTLGSPLLFYNRKSTTTAQLIKWSDSSTSSSYNAPSNSVNSGAQTINFNTEIDEYDLVAYENSLFKNFYNSYISNLYNKNARLFVFDAIFPQWFILTYQLNDILVINSRPYRINSLKVNPRTGKGKIELLNLL